ncbi:MAG: RNA polymerase sigma factor [Candidatus Pacebacteria bacterium]|nr:RNA polymerase sigma factor [Candidatus Paceibacterota bacterium]
MKPKEFSDEQLVEIIRKENQELYSEIIRRYDKKLTHYLRKFIYNPDELEDVLQVVFIKVYKNLYGFNVDKKFSSWIYRIAHNEALNHLKKYARERISLDEVEYMIIDEKIDIGGDVDKKILKDSVEKLLKDIKSKYREPLILFYFEQKSYQEISDILRIPTSTVGTLISRGKKIIKEKLKNEKIYGK